MYANTNQTKIYKMIVPDDEIVKPQEALHIISWEPDFGGFPNSNRNDAILAHSDVTDASYNFDSNFEQLSHEKNLVDTSPLD